MQGVANKQKMNAFIKKSLLLLAAISSFESLAQIPRFSDEDKRWVADIIPQINGAPSEASEKASESEKVAHFTAYTNFFLSEWILPKLATKIAAQENATLKGDTRKAEKIAAEINYLLDALDSSIRVPWKPNLNYEENLANYGVKVQKNKKGFALFNEKGAALITTDATKCQNMANAIAGEIKEDIKKHGGFENFKADRIKSLYKIQRYLSY